jgi:predicted membrane protein
MKQYKNQIKWLARIIGLASSFYFLIFYVGDHVSELISQQDRTSTSILFLLLFTIAGYIFAWFREREGGIIMTFAGLILGMYLFYSKSNTHTFISILYALPFFISGLLFYWYSELDKNSNNPN